MKGVRESEREGNNETLFVLFPFLKFKGKVKRLSYITELQETYLIISGEVMSGQEPASGRINSCICILGTRYQHMYGHGFVRMDLSAHRHTHTYIDIYR